MAEKNVNANVKIVILPNAEKARYSGTERRKIQEAVRNTVLLSSVEPYFKVQVVIKYRRDGTPRFLVAFMLQTYTYTADVFRINVDAEYRPTSFTVLTGEQINEINIAPPDVPAKRVRAVDMVFGTPIMANDTTNHTARPAVEYAYNLATTLGYKAVKLIGKSASVVNYRKYMTRHLKAFGHVGHGYTGGIVLSDGNLTSTWLDGLTHKEVSPAVIFLNSCLSFLPPLQTDAMKAGARTFVGGRLRLVIGTSEEVFKCFWTKVLQERKAMKPSLINCVKEHYPTPNAFGLHGETGRF